MIAFVVWRPVVGFEGLYEVSNRGRIRSVMSSASRMSGRVLRPGLRADGHLQVTLCRDGERHSVKVHRVVAEAFLPRAEAAELVRHRDGVPANNVVHNLAWGTVVENRQDRIVHGGDHNLNKTHCKRNHPFDAVNTITRRSGKRECRACRRLRERSPR